MKSSIKKAKRLEISGVVQGVGFRPFLFQLAGKYGFKGSVLNTPQGVSLVIEGKEELMDDFCRDIYHKSPPLARVVDIKTEFIPLSNYKSFTIVTSRDGNSVRSALISPDVSVCDDCLNEMNDPENRRFRYPFINCTNCGPRYTIIKDIPYDRPKTSMAGFKMCSQCSREYNDPEDRRFHAQPNACPICGPHAFLVNKKNEKIDLKGEDPVQAATRLISQGRIVAIKGLGGFHLAADAFNDAAVKRLRLFKNRPHKPFGLMADSVETVSNYALISHNEKTLLESAARPIVLLKKKELKQNTKIKKISGSIAPLSKYLGIMLPYTPLHYLLFGDKPGIFVMTSGNSSGEPLCIDNQNALKALRNTADYFLIHDRDIYFRADDSIVCFQYKAPRFLRRSRGYAPLPIFLKKPLPEILACGGGLKSTICLTKENRAFLSQHIGDLDNRKIFEFYKKSIEHLKNILDISPEIIVHDLHPGYLSTSYAENLQGVKKIGVQHHHAHAVSCMAENGVSGQVIAVTLDGTGLGIDGKIWGGEVLLCDEISFKRMGHLSYLPMPGSESAVFEPWRMGAAYLYKAFGKELINLDLPFISLCGKDKLEFITTMIDKKINSPLTSSCGRLFDAISAILGIRTKISFEGQAAMELETISSQLGFNEIELGENDSVLPRLSSQSSKKNHFGLHDISSNKKKNSMPAGNNQNEKNNILGNSKIPGTHSRPAHTVIPEVGENDCYNFIIKLSKELSKEHVYKANVPLMLRENVADDTEGIEFGREDSLSDRTALFQASKKRNSYDIERNLYDSWDQRCCTRKKMSDTVKKQDMTSRFFKVTLKSGETFTLADILEIDMIPVVKGIIDDLKRNKPVSFIGRKFHNTVIAAFADTVMYVSRVTGITQVVLSGGVFNNSIILEGLCTKLEKMGIKVYTHTAVPAGDGGISLGQAVIAGTILCSRR